MAERILPDAHYIWLAAVAAVAVSFFLTGALRRFALARKIIDIPNERSSHFSPMPRGGGLAIVITFLVGLLAMRAAGYMPAFLFPALFGAGTWTALIGWIDDRRGMPAWIRLIGHFIAAGWALVWMGGLPQLMFSGHMIDLGWVGHVLAAFCLVWLLNLYNFMDGIDGIAGIEAVTVCSGGLILWILSPANGVLWMVCLLAAASSAGFLFWNFPRAKIFMGDSGSGFLGLVLGILCLQAGYASPGLFWGWLILPGTFVADATVTLLRRALRGEKIYQAHRTHAYQHAARIAGAHWPVALVYGAVNIFWLLPVAALAVTGIIDGAVGAVIAYTPLICAAYFLGAGTKAASL